MKNHYFLMVLLAFCFIRSAGAEYELGEHPRIYITPEMLPALAERTRGNGMLAEDYALIKREADYFVQQGALKRPDSQWHPPYDMVCAALCYLVERELGNPDIQAYAEAVKKVWGDGMILTNIGNGHFGNYAIVFDWIYDGLTPEERTFFGDKLGGWLYWYTNTPEIILLNGNFLYNQTWGPAHLNIGNTRDGITPKLFVALALSGAGTQFEDACKRFLDSWYNRVPSECIPLFDEMGGVWSESMGHGSYGPVKVIPWAFEAWRTSTGLDWFELGTPTTYLKEMNKWAVHLRLPFSGRTAYIDDNDGDFLENQWVVTAPILGARYKDPVANYISTLYNRGTWSESWRFIPFLRFITYDTNVPTRTPAQANWPVARLFTGAGHVYMRSRWDDPNATWAFFGAGPQFAAHSRDDEGHFLIAKKGWLVCRAGGNGHNDDDYYCGGSLVFNIVTIFDPTETFDRLTPGDAAVAAGGTKNERDGGLIRYVYTTNGRNRATMTAYKHERKYTYAAANLSKAYRSTKVSEVTRQFLYLRGEREFFVIFDRIDARKAEFPKTWFLHIPTEPTFQGTETEITADHVYSYTDGNTATWLSDPAGIDQEEVLSTGRSRAFLKTLWPRGAVITKRGGEGYEFWGHPHEPTAQYNHVGTRSYDPPVVPWRLEVEAPAGLTRDYFLHVLEIGEEEDTGMSAVTLIDQSTGYLGVRVEPDRGEPVEVLFTTEGTTAAQVKFGDEADFEGLPTKIDTTIEVGLKGDYDEDGQVGIADVVTLLLKGREDPDYLILDFNGDGRYSITDAVALLLYIRQQGSSTLLARASKSEPMNLSSGERSYLWEVLKQLRLTDTELQELRTLIGPLEPPKTFSLYQNSPNPLNPSTTITYAIPEGAGVETRLEVYNLRGALVRVLVDEVKEPGVYHVFWDGTDSRGQDVPSGVYFYRLRAGDQTRVRKMIVLR
ncbi:MAG TPA: T9SS type A sorting domain-containing protein [archaeon]|nr:T9SS type A sorting domain-containing protein [archaeon]